ncbi:MAG: porphobilinogen synthase [Phycisphaerae bacterium]|nr:porphobilinogen synthase [Phycisphaerae bacterium]
MLFPTTRLSRLRANKNLRAMVRQTTVTVSDLVMPMFIHHGHDIKNPIPSMPGIYQMSIDHACDHAAELYEKGIRSVLLFGIPAKKDELGSDSLSDEGIIQTALRRLKKEVPGLTYMTDVCFCEYTSHGHCGVMVKRDGQMILDHDATLGNLRRQAISHVQAGSDMLAPSGMIDGGVGAIREALEAESFGHVPIMSYSAKYASAFYGPFRDAAGGAPAFGDRRSHQMDPGNSDEAVLEASQDIAEGADIVMVKPALAYLDIISRLKTNFDVPVAAYNVSGEYSMIKAAAAHGWLDERAVIIETLTAIKRAGADIIISYHTAEAASWLK